jgi:hypothetical protein
MKNKKCAAKNQAKTKCAGEVKEREIFGGAMKANLCDVHYKEAEDGYNILINKMIKN